MIEFKIQADIFLIACIFPLPNRAWKQTMSLAKFQCIKYLKSSNIWFHNCATLPYKGIWMHKICLWLYYTLEEGKNIDESRPTK